MSVQRSLALLQVALLLQLARACGAFVLVEEPDSGVRL
jgi:hypothetical protein